MPSRASKRTILDELEDTNTLAARIVAHTTGQQPPVRKPRLPKEEGGISLWLSRTDADSIQRFKAVITSKCASRQIP
jgi:hypothetical protein